MREIAPAPGILLVDDEPGILSSLQRLLAVAGYAVITADSGSAGLAALQQHGSEVGLIVADIRLPDMSGREMIRRATQRFGARPVLYIGGVRENVFEGDARTDRPPFLPKPFETEELLASVTQLLASRGDGGA